MQSLQTVHVLFRHKMRSPSLPSVPFLICSSAKLDWLHKMRELLPTEKEDPRTKAPKEIRRRNNFKSPSREIYQTTFCRMMKLFAGWGTARAWEEMCFIQDKAPGPCILLWWTGLLVICHHSHFANFYTGNLVTRSFELEPVQLCVQFATIITVS